MVLQGQDGEREREKNTVSVATLASHAALLPRGVVCV